MMYFANKLNKEGGNTYPCHTAVPILNQAVVPCSVLTIASWPTYRFLRRQIRWSCTSIFRNFPKFTAINPKALHSQWSRSRCFFLELPCFLHDPMILNIWSLAALPFLNPTCTSWWFSVHILLKPSLKDFEHNLPITWNEQLHGSLNILWHCPSLQVEWNLTFSSAMATAEFSKFADIECRTLTASFF